MDYKIHEYNGNGLDNIFKFECDYVFATDVLAFVNALPDGSRWFLWRAQCISAGVFIITFRTNEYLSPGNPNDILRVKAVAPKVRGLDWTISLC